MQKPYTWTFSSNPRFLGFEPDKGRGRITCDDGVRIGGQHQNGNFTQHDFAGVSDVVVQPRHARIGDNHFSRVTVNRNMVTFNGGPAGFRLHTIQVTCNP